MAIVQNVFYKFDDRQAAIANRVEARIVKIFESSPYQPCQLTKDEFKNWSKKLPIEHDEDQRLIALGALKAFYYLKNHPVTQIFTTA